VGSFLNVVIYRTINNQSFIKGRSKCDNCGKKINWYDNIPILSYLLLKGQARCCKRPIPISYLVVELITGVMFVWWYWFGSFFFRLSLQPLETLQPFFWLLVGILLLIIFFTDLLYMVIPDFVVGFLLAITLLYRLVLISQGAMQLQDFIYALAGVVVALLMIGGLWWGSKGRAMGLGDVKFCVPMALLLGWPQIITGLFLSFVIGGLFGVGLLLTAKKKFGQVVPFGPFLVIGTILTLVWGDQLFAWYWQLLY
jgi:leader peptidase (prepilin peptidase)/N-methyltransferase